MSLTRVDFACTATNGIIVVKAHSVAIPKNSPFRVKKTPLNGLMTPQPITSPLDQTSLKRTTGRPYLTVPSEENTTELSFPADIADDSGEPANPIETKACSLSIISIVTSKYRASGMSTTTQPLI
ncbi:hypothetical protein DQ04_06371020 [Trypanosoma grayi]|uniref:hypothetical protein n=1 Tax=Trypanosoma grayi TaxID=71804 RepID=UPI0004F3F42B|nr:hypothetical protein DQ04_06371020 [Trypanosoma grayi]KEG08829.1 hypothetical protein DQ04_06371020 [Trypanosoma grayi]